MKVVSVVGARPQFIKSAPVSKALGSEQIEDVLVHTGQHHDEALSDVFFSELGLAPPAYNLGVHGGTHGEMTGRMLPRLETVLTDQQPSLVLLYGDTNSTLAGALSASKLGIPIAHVEAGLRSFNRRMAEEVNRVVTDTLSALLFCPTTTSVDNLRVEGITSGVHLVGDVMYDVALEMSRSASGSSTVLHDLDLPDGGYGLATIHRAENTDDGQRLGLLVDYLRSEARNRPIVFPLHPRTASALARDGLDLGKLRTIPPVGYLDMTALIQGAACVYTDSGGLQKEAYFYRVPCVTLRDETEWIETIEAGWNRLWTQDEYRPRREISEYGDGTASRKIAQAIATFVG